MFREDVGEVLRLAAAPTFERLRHDRRRRPARFAPLFRAIENGVFSRGFDIQTARRQSGVGPRSRLSLGMTLAAYLQELRIETAVRMLEIAAGRIPAGRIAAAVGFADYRTFLRAFRRVTGGSPPSVQLPERLSPAFDVVGWHHARRGTLALDDVRTLLCRLHDGEPAPPSGDRSADASVEPFPGRCGGISWADARAAVERAAEAPRRRLLGDLEGLPPHLAAVLADAAEHLPDPGWTGEASCRRAGVRDTAVSTKVRFYLGEPLADAVDRLRVETAVRLVGDARFTGGQIAEGVGWSAHRLKRSLRRRAGATVGELRATLRESVGDPVYELWRRAGAGRLPPADARALEDYLRGLYPGDLLPRPPAALAVRHDVDPRHVEVVLDVCRFPHRRDAAVTRKLDEVLRTHPLYSAAHWYTCWIRDRLGRDSLDAAWEEWRKADRDLAELLRLPRDQRLERVTEEHRFQSDAFLWLLVDSIHARLFHDAGESEHFADLAVAAAEARRRSDPASAGFLGLALAFKGNAYQRRNDLAAASRFFERAFAAIEAAEVAPWIRGLMLSLHASTLDRQGEATAARRGLFRAGALLKKAGDELERLRCVIKRSSTWFAAAKDPTRLLTICIDILERRYPFETDLRQCAHVNRITSQVYLADRMTGRYLERIRSLRQAMPPPTSPYAAASRQQLDGLLAALSEDFETAVDKLLVATAWFQEHDLESHASVCRLQYAWAALDFDSEGACRAARTACSYLQSTGFKSHGLEKIAFKIQADAEQHRLARGSLRHAILLSVCPRMEAKLLA